MMAGSRVEGSSWWCALESDLVPIYSTYLVVGGMVWLSTGLDGCRFGLRVA